MSIPALARAAGLRSGRLWRLGLGIALGAGAILAAAGLLATSGYLISRAAEQPPILTLTVAIVGVRFFGVSRAVLRYLERLVMHDAALRAASRLRVAVFRGAARRPPEYAPGDVLSRLVDDVDRLQDVLVRIVGPPLISLATILAVSGVAFLILPAVGAVLFVGLTAAAATTFVLGHLGNVRAGRREAPARGALAVRLNDLVAGAPELAVNGAGSRQEEAVMAAERDLARASRASAWTAGLTGGGVAAATGATVVVVLIVSGGAVGDGVIGGVLVAALALLALASFEGVAPLGGAGERLGPVLGASTRVGPLIDSPVIREAATKTVALPPRGSDLRGRAISVRYAPGRTRALDDLDVTVAPGRRVALVGASGSGKSTAAHVLAGLTLPEAGYVTYGGRDIRALDEGRLRERVRLLAQDAHLFATTIADNVRLGRPEATDAEVRGVLREVGLEEWIASLPEGADTPVGEDGVLLSGGQRQRLILARALISRAEILIFDEPTVHMDDGDAVRFIRDIDRVTGDAGVMVITHRLGGLESFDEIIVLDGGRVSARGTHRELMAAGGWYAASVEGQRGAAAPGPGSVVA